MRVGELTEQTIFQQSPISTQIFSPDGTSLMANKAWERLWGIKHAQIKGYNILRDKQLSKRKIMGYIRRAFKGQVVEIPAIRYIPTETVPLQNAVAFRFVKAVMYPVKDKYGKIIRIVLQHEDLTDRFEYEEEIKRNEERLRLALDAGKIGVWDWDIKKNTVTWSDRIYEIHGVKKDDFDGTIEAFNTVIYPDDAVRVQEAIRQALISNAPYELEFRAYGPGKKVIWIFTSARVLFDKKGQPVRMLGATIDITERKKLEKQKDDFIGLASHELKTPVTSIKAYGQAMQRTFRKKGDTESVVLLQKMDVQINKLTNLIGDLLDVTRIHEGRLEFRNEFFDLNTLIREVVEELQRTTEKHTVVMKLSSTRKIYGDRERYGQVLANLLSNAIKYSPNADKIFVRSQRQRSVMILSVRDYGIGIPKDKQSSIFERFYRIEDAKTNTYPGLGLGLFISNEIIKRQNGTLWVESPVKRKEASDGGRRKGSVFKFTIPLRKKAERKT